MSCPTTKRLAAATLGADPRALVHAETCERCSSELAAMVEVGAFARRAPVRAASADRRARIAAHVMASADVVDVEPVRRSRAPVAMFAVAALAAAVAIVVWRVQPPVQYAVAWPAMVPRAPSPHVASALAPPPPVVRESSPVPHEPSRAAVPVPVPVPAPAPVATATNQSTATATTRVFAGSQERKREGQLARDQVTLEPGPIVARAHVVAPTAFERGWTALREARYADAIAEFDQVTDPAIGEDAAYWAAIASARGGDKADAMRRLTAFIANYPSSERVTEARALLARLPP